MDAILAAGLRKRYGRGARAVEALRGVSLQVRPGEIYGLLGRNGAGKTTLIKILLDIVRADAGEGRILDQPSGRPQARRPVGYLPEDHRFPEYQTGESALRLHGAMAGVASATLRRRVPELLELVGLTAAAGRKVRGYSKGMKQRLGLAQALVGDPRILFLDEPTDGVDPVGRAEIRALLERLKQQDRTIFLNSHLLSEVERVCDRVGILEGGLLVREGTLDALTRAGNVFRIETAPPPTPELLEQLRALVVAVEAFPGGVEVSVEREPDVDRVVDLLRARGVGIRGLAGKRLSLEEVFLQTLEAGA